MVHSCRRGPIQSFARAFVEQTRPAGVAVPGNMDHHRNFPTRLHSQRLGRLYLNDVAGLGMISKPGEPAHRRRGGPRLPSARQHQGRNHSPHTAEAGQPYPSKPRALRLPCKLPRMN